MTEWKAIGDASRAAWDQNAEFWDSYMAEGGSFQRQLIGPATERLLAVRPDERVLDIACGNGAFARRLAQLGAWVVAADFSDKFLALARARTREHAERIDYRLADATDEAQLLALAGRGHFHAAVCTMALMDMPAIEPLFTALGQLLQPGGRFVFSVMHPCFNSNGPLKLLEEEDREGERVAAHWLKVRHYARPKSWTGLGIAGQPAPHYYFHRPLHELLGAGFRAGFVLDGLEEPTFPPGAPGARRPTSWENFPEIPPVLVARLSLIARGRPG